MAFLTGPYILPETNSQRTRKWDGWNTIVLFPLGIWPFLRCELLVSGWVYTVHIIPYESMFKFAGQGCLFVIFRSSYPFRMADLTAL